MQFSFSSDGNRDYAGLSEPLKKMFKKQLSFLLKDLRYPSLNAKKYKGCSNVWQARVSQDFRFYFCIEGDVYVILGIVKHPK